jgi:hypothetical protein
MQGSVRTHLAAVAALVILAPAAGAQAIDRAEVERPGTIPAAAPAIPSRDAASVAVRAPLADRELSGDAEPLAAAALGRGESLMILGGAALLAGLIIGDDAGTVIAVGGAVVGLYGLYVYLGAP